MIVKSYVDMKLLLRSLASSDVWAFDVETAPPDLFKPELAVNPRKNIVIGLAVSNGKQSFYVVHKHLTAGVLRTYLDKPVIEQFLRALAVKKLVTFNGSFDVRSTKNTFGIDLADSIYSEVQLARHTANEESDPYAGLKAEGAKLFGTNATDEQDKLTSEILAAGGSKGHVWLGSLSTVAEYAKKDVELTLAVNDHYLAQIKSQGLEKFYYEDEVMPCFRLVTIPLEDVGIAVDTELISKTQSEMAKDLVDIETEVRQLIAPHRQKFDEWYQQKEFPVKKTGPFVQQLAAYYGLELPRTPGGAFSLTAKNLAALPADNPFRLFMSDSYRLPPDVVSAVQKSLIGDVDPFLLTSKHHWGKIFFDQLGETPLSYTEKTQKPQIDDNFLQSIRAKYRFVDLLVDFNRITKLKGTYVDRYAEEVEDGRFYGRFSQHITSTGRMSSDLQQLPKKIDPDDAEQQSDSQRVQNYVNRIRDFFVASPGKVLVGADYSALEVVIFADDAGDEPLLNMIRQKYDPYSQGAIDVWGLTQFSADKKAPNFLKLHKPKVRQDTKVWFLGLRYGMGTYKLSKTLEISETEAADVSRRYFAAYPKLKARMDSILLAAKTNGYVKSQGGRIRHVSLLKTLHERYGNVFADSLRLWEKYNETPQKYAEMKYLKKQYWGMVNTVLNFPIQSMAASVVTRASVELVKQIRQHGLGAKLILTLHDELCLEVDQKDTDAVVNLMRDVMENTTKLSVPLTAIPVVGQKYGDLK